VKGHSFPPEGTGKTPEYNQKAYKTMQQMEMERFIGLLLKKIYSDGYYIFDPSYSDTPVLKNDYFKMLNGKLNGSKLLVVETVPYSVR